jgi:hypothetical protein
MECIDRKNEEHPDHSLQQGLFLAVPKLSAFLSSLEQVARRVNDRVDNVIFTMSKISSTAFKVDMRRDSG